MKLTADGVMQFACNSCFAAFCKRSIQGLSRGADDVFSRCADNLMLLAPLPLFACVEVGLTLHGLRMNSCMPAIVLKKDDTILR